MITHIAASGTLHGIREYFFLFTLSLVTLIIINAILSLLIPARAFKPWIILLLVSASVVSYFMDSYHVLFDKNMLQNVMQTDYRETYDLLSWKMFFEILLFGILPAGLVLMMPMSYPGWRQEVTQKAWLAGGSCLAIGLIVILQYQQYASMARNNRHLRDRVIPLNYVYASYSLAKTTLSNSSRPLEQIGLDAKPGPAWAHSHKKTITVLVVGETARAANFALQGYNRNTNPELAAEDVVYFTNFHSCGTETAVSVPCMFSHFGRNDYDEGAASHTENVLDVFHHAALTATWIDNNSGCKGTCTRIEHIDAEKVGTPEFCNENGCYDDSLLAPLAQKIENITNSDSPGGIIVLHQKGSHGPSYYERTPESFWRYQPICHTNQIQECTRSEIVNTYDNTILYTDHNLANIIRLLKSGHKNYDASLFYVSDHGESLGENSLYLHAIPYSIAPDEQTHVPAVFWASSGYLQRFGIDKHCVANEASRAYSHDNLFDSMLGLMDIQTSEYRAMNDIFSTCKSGKSSKAA